MTTSSPACGTEPPLQSAAVLHSPLDATFQLTVLRRRRRSNNSTRKEDGRGCRLIEMSYYSRQCMSSKIRWSSRLSRSSGSNSRQQTAWPESSISFPVDPVHGEMGEPSIAFAFEKTADRIIGHLYQNRIAETPGNSTGAIYNPLARAQFAGCQFLAQPHIGNIKQCVARSGDATQRGDDRLGQLCGLKS